MDLTLNIFYICKYDCCFKGIIYKLDIRGPIGVCKIRGQIILINTSVTVVLKQVFAPLADFVILRPQIAVSGVLAWELDLCSAKPLHGLSIFRQDSGVLNVLITNTQYSVHIHSIIFIFIQFIFIKRSFI